MRRVLVLSVSGLAVVCALAAGAQSKPQQKVTPPEARYWMGATTGAGMMSVMGGSGDFSMGDAMRMAAGGAPSFSQSVELRLGSSLTAGGLPEAAHAMPAAAQVNKPIVLVTPQRQQTSGRSGSFEQPKGSIKFYWGCGERAGPGQPVTLTYDKLLRGENDPEIAALRGSVDARDVPKPTQSNSRTYGDWPNSDDRRNAGLKARFAPGASLAGGHEIKGNYTPQINFTLPSDKTFMAPLRFNSTAKLASGAIKIDWASLPRATGYSLALMTGQERAGGGGDVVMWSSANRPATFLMSEDLAPAEVQRLIGLKAVLAPSTTTCTIPKEVLDEVARGGERGGGGMLWTTAYGDQFTQIWPERPADAKVTWDQESFVRVNFKSVRMDVVSPEGIQDMSAMMAGGGRPGMAARDPAQMSDADYCAMLAEQKRNQPSAAQTIGEATGIPGAGMLGRALGNRKKKDEPVDPRCAKK
jgi:hypothetical protein